MLCSKNTSRTRRNTGHLPGTLYLAMAAACARALSSPPPALLTGRGALMGASPSPPLTCAIVQEWHCN